MRVLPFFLATFLLCSLQLTALQYEEVYAKCSTCSAGPQGDPGSGGVGPNGPTGPAGPTGTSGPTGIDPSGATVFCNLNFLQGRIQLPVSGTVTGSGDGYTYEASPTLIAIFPTISNFNYAMVATAEGTSGVSVDVTISDTVVFLALSGILDTAGTFVNFILVGCEEA